MSDVRSPVEADSQPLEKRGDNRSQRPSSAAFREFIGGGWGPRTSGVCESAAAPFAAARRARLSARFAGYALVIGAGPLVVRNNDCDYRFRPSSAFAHMLGTGTDFEPGAVLVMMPGERGHRAVLFFRPRASRSSEEFYADSRYGELWVGARPTLEEVAVLTGVECEHIDNLGAVLAQHAPNLAVLRESDRDLIELVDSLRCEAGVSASGAAPVDSLLEQELSELRLRKDEYELAQMQLAVDTTREGFNRIIASLPRAVGHARGERVIEGAFGALAREEGNGLGYETIAASGNNANTLHWIGNDGPVMPGDMVLIDAGVELDSLYTADITRTIPVSGKFSQVQRRIYDAVLDAADAAFARASEKGARFRDLHAAAMEVLAARLEQWGLLPVSAEQSLAAEGQFHRRWMVHGTSHHLGLDVHDCARARREMYLDALLEPGMCFTIEPGLYFRADDLRVPPEFRGQAVRIEDNIYLDSTGRAVRMSEGIARTADDVENWISKIIPKSS